VPIMAEIVKEFHFEAAHFLPRVHETHKCKNLHGHSYTVKIRAVGPVNPETGWVFDFGQLKEVMNPLLAKLDHQVLNNVAGLENPTCENVAIWILENLHAHNPYIAAVTIVATHSAEVTVRNWREPQNVS
jgi:6-pyruvoyltetrahydropterin/6-carboxytetrahydropterin synthase